ncbi:cleft lip and palate associated transmembrane protein [Schizopora paradoxa]|uniref:Cleft lip and palate associated transmembrane protein n=1 Tax=Schizopora paradoxa TaxID=27342 RepID=A0A0H2RSP1_9AGAM|nr:cleft lip and palate associated transmembrane protein [Schizopora paradoxa]
MPGQGAQQPAARNAGNVQPGQPEESRFSQFWRMAQQAILFYVISQLAVKFLSSKVSPPAPPASTPTLFDPSSPPPEQTNAFSLPPAQAELLWPIGISLDMHVYLSTSPNGDVFAHQRTMNYNKEELPSFVWGNITFGDWNEKRAVDFDVTIPTKVQNNGSLWADIFVVQAGVNPDPSNPAFNPNAIHHVRKLLTRYLPKPKQRKEKKLIGGGAEDEEIEIEEPDVIISYWHKNLTLALVSDATSIPYSQLPPPVAEHVHLVSNLRDETGKKGYYLPVVFPNDFWQLRSQLVEINSTTPELPLRIEFQPMSYFKFQLFASLGFGFSEAAKQQGGSANAELDEIKRMLTETNPYFLLLTATVSVLHVVFEMLAFKSDVSHWRQRKELVGVSVRTIITNVFVQLIILLYLVDNNENTSWMILMGQGMGMVIEAWKITKAVDIKVIPAGPGSLLPYKLDIKDKHVLSEDEKKTQEYDKLAFRLVSYVTIPLLVGYTIYSLIYETHRGWYSFIISTLTSFVYMFGFVQLVPQLIINYKLKSVAHMPMKAMIYKTLSTVVDDLFAFCIKMPILHRLACFRDDVVFLVFLYQRWIYRVDPKRINEYGQVLESEETSVDRKDGKETKKNK